MIDTVAINAQRIRETQAWATRHGQVVEVRVARYIDNIVSFPNDASWPNEDGSVSGWFNTTGEDLFYTRAEAVEVARAYIAAERAKLDVLDRWL
jgi:hypothetical protein